jgi:hypothetical protein
LDDGLILGQIETDLDFARSNNVSDMFPRLIEFISKTPIGSIGTPVESLAFAQGTAPVEATSSQDGRPILHFDEMNPLFTSIFTVSSFLFATVSRSKPFGNYPAGCKLSRSGVRAIVGLYITDA